MEASTNTQSEGMIGATGIEQSKEDVGSAHTLDHLPMSQSDDGLRNSSQDLSRIFSVTEAGGRPLTPHEIVITSGGLIHLPERAGNDIAAIWVVNAPDRHEALVAAKNNRDVRINANRIAEANKPRAKVSPHQPMPLDDYLELVRIWNPHAQYDHGHDIWARHRRIGETLAKHKADSPEHRAAFETRSNGTARRVIREQLDQAHAWLEGKSKDRGALGIPAHELAAKVAAAFPGFTADGSTLVYALEADTTLVGDLLAYGPSKLDVTAELERI